jgi:glycosyltransferase involved in cell wall biosynthesis
MRICLFSHDFRPSIGGLETASELLAGYLSEAGVDVVVVTRTPLGDGEPSPASYPVVRRPRWGELVELLRGCDLLHTNCMSFSVLAAGRLARVPVVLVHSSYSPVMHRNLRERRTFLSREEVWRIVHARSSKVGMRFADQNVCISHASFRALQPPRGAVLHLPIEFGSLFRPMPEVRQTDRFAFFGRLVVHKGCDVLLRALVRCRRRGYRLGVDVYGEGPDHERLLRLTRRYGLDDGAVAFHGFLRGEELARAYNRAFAVVAPSLWHEPLGMVAVEAMACGRAVVASEDGGLGELVAGRGLTFPSGDAEALSRRLIELHENPGVLAECEAGGPSFARRFAVERAGRKYLAVYRAILDERGRGPLAPVTVLGGS